MYSASGRTAAATLAGSVHGVVVQTMSDSPSRSASGRRTKRDGCVSSSYLSSPACSCWESEVPQRGHHCVERWPLYSQPRSWTAFRNRQMYSMFVSENVKYEFSQSIHCPRRFDCSVITPE